MKSKFMQTVAIVLLAITLSISQDVKVDLIVNANKENETYKLMDLVSAVSSELSTGCVEYTVIPNAEAAQNDIVIELWDSKEYLDQKIFKLTRKETKTSPQGKETVTKRKVAGIAVQDEVKILGRMTERESGSVIDLFVLLGTVGHEYDVPEVAESWTKDPTEFRRIQENILFNNEDIVTEGRAANVTSLKEKLSESIKLMVADNLLEEAKIVGVAKQKKDKVKKAKIEKCDEVDIGKYGALYYGIKEASEYKGQKIYREVGTCYYDKDESIVGIRKGEKELLPLINSDSELYVADANAIDQSNLSKFKVENPTDISFVFMYDPTHPYSDLDRLHIEFLYQASMIGYRDVRVIANDAVTQSINETMGKSIYSVGEGKDAKVELNLDNIKSTNTIYVGLSNPKKVPTSLAKLFGRTNDPDALYLQSTIKYKDGVVEMNDNEDRKLLKNKSGYYFDTHEADFGSVRSLIQDNALTILGPEEEKKGKVKSVIVTSHAPLEKGDKYEFYDKPIGKKVKQVVEVKIDELLNTYTAIAKVRDGEKKVLDLLSSGKKLRSMKKSGGLLGAVLGSSYPKLKLYRTYHEIL